MKDINSDKIGPIRVLLIEDNPGDVVLVREALREADGEQFELTAVARLNDALKKLGKTTFDIILADQSLPDSLGLDTFAALHANSPDLPIVIITGLASNAVGLEAVAMGAQDYLVKGQVSGPLMVRAVRYSIERKRLLRERDGLILKLQAALAEVKTLSGLLPICSYCKKVRDDHGYWQQIEIYVREHSQAKFTHGMCPKCVGELYPEYVKDLETVNESDRE